MKKVVRKVWIGLLSGLALLVGCCTQNKINNQENPENQEDKQQKVVQLSHQLDSINAIIRERESSCVYGSPEIIQQYGEETRRLRQEAENIIQQIKELKNE